MDILELAKNIEKEGIEYYTKLAEDSSVKELAGIYNLLAGEERKHYDTFDTWQKKQGKDYFESTDIIAKAKEAFISLANDIDFEKSLYDYVTPYEKALSLEQNSISFYEDAMGKNDNQDQRELIQAVLNEEKKHEKIVQGILDFVNKPKEWLENAEWHHMDEY